MDVGLHSQRRSHHIEEGLTPFVSLYCSLEYMIYKDMEKRTINTGTSTSCKVWTSQLSKAEDDISKASARLEHLFGQAGQENSQGGCVYYYYYSYY
jgi:hypothetical protein